MTTLSKEELSALRDHLTENCASGVNDLRLVTRGECWRFLILAEWAQGVDGVLILIGFIDDLRRVRKISSSEMHLNCTCTDSTC